MPINRIFPPLKTFPPGTLGDELQYHPIPSAHQDATDEQIKLASDTWREIGRKEGAEEMRKALATQHSAALKIAGEREYGNGVRDGLGFAVAAVVVLGVILVWGT